MINSFLKYRFNYNYYLTKNHRANFFDTQLFQVGEALCAPGFSVPEHVQQGFELTVVIDGKGKSSTNGTFYDIGKGDIHISLAGEQHAIISDCENPLRFYFIWFEILDKAVLAVKDRIVELVINRQKSVVKDDGEITRLLSQTIGEVAAKREYYDLAIQTNLKKIILSLFRIVNNDFISKGYIQFGDKQLLLQRVVSYIDENIAQMHNLSCIKEEFQYNYSYISHCFSTMFGKTMQQYYLEKRGEAAKTLFKEKKYTISKVADVLNFESIYSFSRFFKNLYGIPPSQFLADQKAATSK